MEKIRVGKYHVQNTTHTIVASVGKKSDLGEKLLMPAWYQDRMVRSEYNAIITEIAEFKRAKKAKRYLGICQLC